MNKDELEQINKMGLDLDNEIEKLQLARADLNTSLRAVYKFLNRKINLKILFVETQDENLNNKVFCFGDGDENIKRHMPQLVKITKNESFETPDLRWFIQPLELAGEQVGSIGLGFDLSSPMRSEFGLEMLNTVSEELDNFFFSIQQGRLKHSIIMGIQSALKSHSIVDAVDRAVYVISKEVLFDKLVILYSDRELTGIEKINYMIYEKTTRVFDSFINKNADMDAFILNHSRPLAASNDVIKDILGVRDLTISYLMDGLINENLIGKAIFIPEDGKNFSIFSREIVQVFTETLRQRFVDYNRERNTLRKFFSDNVIHELVNEVGYDETYLSPRHEEIGIIFADISGFTKMSEQILKTPERITKLVNDWSEGIVERVYPLGAVLDKLVGDCVILLFGPPFYRATPEEIVEASINAAKIIVDFTAEFLNRPEYKDIQAHIDFPKFGVAIGINFCSAVVGLIGPNKDMTAFSSGMNNTARLQGVAKANQILVTNRINELADKKWKFEGPYSAEVKNVKDPLKYFDLK